MAIIILDMHTIEPHFSWRFQNGIAFAKYFQKIQTSRGAEWFWIESQKTLIMSGFYHTFLGNETLPKG